MKLFISILFLSLNLQANELFIDDPRTLMNLEEQGLDFSRFVLKVENRAPHNEALYKASSNYAFFTQTLSQDLQDLQKADAKLSIRMNTIHRLFDFQWLVSNYSFYELVGIVNRMDRLSFNPKTCGELRFIYRLAYKTLDEMADYSRLPMTVNAVFWIPRTQNGCGNAVKSWKKFVQSPLEAGIKSLPLGEIKSIELNLQSVRWPSTIRPDMAGYAEYILRVFQVQHGKWVQGLLENTLNVEKIESSPQLINELLTWIRDAGNLKKIDQGVAVLPDKFLASKATSVALHGVHRMKNAPFSRIYSESSFTNLDYSQLQFVKSPHGLLRRMNDLSCVGCHQGRTVAGFHFLGQDKAEIDPVNSIFISASPHFLLDQKRRSQFMRDLQNGASPNPSRAFSVRSLDGEGRMGSHCGLGDPTFASWTCETGYRCEESVQDGRISKTGICVPAVARAGSTCEVGKIKHSPNSWKDGLDLKSQSCGSGSICEVSKVGFPNGMCSNSCSDLKEGEVCGSIAILHSFNDCLAKRKKGATRCLSENIRPGNLQKCDDKTFCRDDYICAKNQQGVGNCIPPYFLFQLRVDGHFSPGLKK